MPESNRITMERLTDWVEGRLPDEEARTVAEQVAGADEETRARVEWLRAFVRASKETQLSAPPREVRERISRRFASLAEERREPGLLRRVVASLSFDSGLQAAASGARTAGAEEEQRQLAFATEVAEIVLDVMPRPGGKSLDLGGQIFPLEDEPPGGFTVQLLHNGVEAGITASDELSEFLLEDVPYGQYELVFSARELEVLIPRFELSP